MNIAGEISQKSAAWSFHIVNSVASSLLRMCIMTILDVFISPISILNEDQISQQSETLSYVIAHLVAS